MKSRESVLRKLKDNVTPNIYFTPPDSVVLKYPACVVTREDIDVLKANNKIYNANIAYKVVYISREEGDDIFLKVMNLFDHSAFRTEYKYNGLYHKVFVVYA